MAASVTSVVVWPGEVVCWAVRAATASVAVSEAWSGRVGRWPDAASAKPPEDRATTRPVAATARTAADRAEGATPLMGREVGERRAAWKAETVASSRCSSEVLPGARRAWIA